LNSKAKNSETKKMRLAFKPSSNPRIIYYLSNLLLVFIGLLVQKQKSIHLL